jgi:hypothetical protein
MIPELKTCTLPSSDRCPTASCLLRVPRGTIGNGHGKSGEYLNIRCHSAPSCPSRHWALESSLSLICHLTTKWKLLRLRRKVGFGDAASRLVANGLVRCFDLFPVFVQPMDVIHEPGVFRAVRLSFFRACGRESILLVRQMNPVTHGL